MAESEIEASADRRLNRLVAATVVVLTVFLVLAHIKDGNLVRTMQFAKTDAVDLWSEYQATRTKLHVSETARAQVVLVAAAAPSPAAAQALAGIDADIAKYRAETPRLRAAATAADARCDALEARHGQFDLVDAFVSVAISLAAVATLAEIFGLLVAAWAFGAVGLVMGVAGFAGWPLYADRLVGLLS